MKCHCLFFILHVNRSAMQRDSLISAINFYCQQWEEYKARIFFLYKIDKSNMIQYIWRYSDGKCYSILDCLYIPTPLTYFRNFHEGINFDVNIWLLTIYIQQCHTKYWMNNIEKYRRRIRNYYIRIE